MLASCRGPRRSPGATADRRVLMVAFDALDPGILESLMRAGRLPNFKRLAEMGTFHALATSTPPHTPVALASMITGADPGLHHIFDFIHRDPNPASSLALRPHFSTAETSQEEDGSPIPLTRWQLPPGGGETRNLRRGPAFWDDLVAEGIDTSVYYLPCTYPAERPEGSGRFRCISGMGTPDLLGGYGEFTLFTPDAPRGGRRVGGGKFTYLSMLRNRGRTELLGPPNFLRTPDANGKIPPLKADLEVVCDPEMNVAKILLAGNLVLLSEGEWSAWISIELRTGIPGSTALQVAGATTSLRGMVRLFLKQVHPKFELYVSPLNIDPSAAVTPISVPGAFAAQLARQHGPFCTLGIPEDTKALTHGALNEDQFLSQCKLALDERIEQYRHALAGFRRGCLCFYFGAPDLLQHMFWRDRDPQHPGHDPRQAERYAHVVEETYVGTDRLVGDALTAVGPDGTLIVVSDHGFTTFRRGFNLNTWLLENGYIRLRDPSRQGKHEMFANVDWSGTKAYGLGMNALYLNEAGREKYGTVRRSARRSLLEEIREELLALRDRDGSAVVDRAYLTEDLYPNADPALAPDLILGYARGYRASWSTVLGKMPHKIVEDNMDRWSGTHLVAAHLVPGILLANRDLTVRDPTVSDIAPTILDEFGIPCPAQMTGRALFTKQTQTSQS